MNRVICNMTHVAKSGRRIKAVRVVDRRIWAKLDSAARGQWIETIRAEVGA